MAAISLSGLIHKYAHVRCVDFGLELGARREHPPSGAVTNEQRRPKPKASQPSGRKFFWGRLRCSLLTDPLRGMLVALASPAPKIPCRERERICELDHLGTNRGRSIARIWRGSRGTRLVSMNFRRRMFDFWKSCGCTGGNGQQPHKIHHEGH